MVIGIEIAPGALRAVRLARTGSIHRLTAQRSGGRVAETAEAPLDALPDDPAALAGALAAPLGALLRRMRANGAKIAVAIPTAWCFYRMVSFPYRSSSRIEGTLRYALEGRLPGQAEEYVVEPLTDILPSGAQGSRMTVAAIRTDQLGALLSAFHSAGADPVIVQPALVSAARCVAKVASVRPDEKALLVRVGGGSAEVGVMSAGSLLACRALRLPESAASPAADSHALAAEVVRMATTLALCEGEGGYSRVILLGTSAGALSDALSKALGVPVETPLEGTDETFAGAWGAALDAVVRGRFAPSLRREAYAYRPYVQRQERRLAAALALAVGIAVIFGVKSLRDIAASGGALERNRSRQADLFREVVSAKTVPVSLFAMEAALEDARKHAAKAGRSQMTSCLEQWVYLMRLLPKGAGVEPQTIDIDQRRVALTLGVPDAATAWDVHNRLRASNQFAPEAPRLSREAGGGAGAYRMELELRRK